MAAKKDYHLLWRLLGKNLRKNKKKFFLFFSSTFLSVVSIFTLVLLRDVLQSLQSSVLRLSKGMLGTMVHGMAVIAVVTGITLMMSLRTYVISRKEDYELLRVLGIPVDKQKKLQLLEYVGSMVMSAVFGALVGICIVFGMRAVMRHVSPYFEGIRVPQFSSYLAAAGICILLFVFCLLINNEVAVETGLASIRKNSFEKSKLPPEFTKWIGFIGLGFVLLGMFVYLGLRDFGEGTLYIVVFFAGALILWLFWGGLFFRKKEAQCEHHPEKMIRWNVFYHRYYSKSFKRFLLFVLTFFLLFYYAAQVAGCFPLGLGKKEFPYEFVLKTRADDEKMQELLELLKTEYQAEIQMFPAVNVVTERGDEFVKDALGTGNCGQNIAIPESVYRKFTGKSLNLTGENAYVVFQQVSGDKAHPIDYATISEMAIHFGSAYIHSGYLTEREIFRIYKIQGQERRVVLGYLGKGYNENIVVFSDEYFQQVVKKGIEQDLATKWYWGPETDPRFANQDEPEKAENYPDSMVVIKVESKDVDTIEALIQEYEQNLPFERKVQGIYDATVKLHYNSKEIIKETIAERTLKLIICGLQFVFLMFVMLYLLYLNMNEDYDMKKRQFEFLRCLGLSKKEAAGAVLYEASFTAYMPVIIGSVVSLIYAVGVPRLRVYTKAEWLHYLPIMGMIWMIAAVVYFAVFYLMKRNVRRKIME